MIFELPLALALTCLLSEVPAVHAVCFSLPARLQAGLVPVIARKRSGRAQEIAAYAVIALFALAAFGLSLLHPALRIALLALFLPMRTVLDQALRVRAFLDSGDVRGAAEALRDGEAGTFEGVVRAAASQASGDAAHIVFAGCLLALVATPLKLGPALAAAYAALVCLAASAPALARIRALCFRWAEAAYAALCALCAALCGLELEAALGMLRTRREGRLTRVICAAVGIGETPTHEPLAGDLVQAAMLLWLALGVSVILLSLILLPFMR